MLVCTWTLVWASQKYLKNQRQEKQVLSDLHKAEPSSAFYISCVISWEFIQNCLSNQWKNIWGKLLLIYNQILKKYRKYRIYWKRNEEWILWWGWEQRMVKWLVSIQYIYSKLSHEGISHIKKEQKGNQLNICHHFGTYFILPPIISYLLLMSLSLLIYNEFPGNKNSYRFILHYP